MRMRTLGRWAARLALAAAFGAGALAVGAPVDGTPAASTAAAPTYQTSEVTWL
jgi:hypothetical protein